VLGERPPRPRESEKRAGTPRRSAGRHERHPAQQVLAVREAVLVVLRTGAEVESLVAALEGVLDRGEDRLHGGVSCAGCFGKAAQPVRDLAAGGDEEVGADGVPVDLDRPEPEPRWRKQAADVREHRLHALVERAGSAALTPAAVMELREAAEILVQPSRRREAEDRAALLEPSPLAARLVAEVRALCSEPILVAAAAQRDGRRAHRFLDVRRRRPSRPRVAQQVRPLRSLRQTLEDDEVGPRVRTCQCGGECGRGLPFSAAPRKWLTAGRGPGAEQPVAGKAAPVVDEERCDAEELAFRAHDDRPERGPVSRDAAPPREHPRRRAIGPVGGDGERVPLLPYALELRTVVHELDLHDQSLTRNVAVRTYYAARMAAPAPGDREAIVERERALRDREAEAYDAHRSQEPWLRDVEDACLLSALRLEPGLTVLDAGCGSGHHLPALLRTASSVVGVDFSERSLAVARARLDSAAEARTRLLAADVRVLPLADGAFDRVLCAQVLQHLPSHEDRLAAARELRRVLRPGGILAATVYRWRGHVRRHKEGFWAGGLYRYAFTAREFRRLLEAAGFSVVEVGGAGVVPAVTRRLGIGVDLQRRLAFTPLGRHLGDYVVVRAVRTA
jgi:SAM-dependent methyltransferase